MSGMTIITLENALMAWVRSVVPVEWLSVFGNQNAPKPVKQVEIRRGTPFIIRPGRDIQGPVNPTDGTAKLLGPREIQYSARAYSKNALQVLEDLRSRLDDEDSLITLLDGNLAVVEIGDVQNLTSLYSSQYVEVGSFDLRLRTHSLREGADAETGVGYIQAVDLERTTKDQAGVASVDHILVGQPAP